ncbi:hypothetical protein Hanom_Chr16g01453331 [Helianthus anomalus]
MALNLKSPHNYLPYLVKYDTNPEFYPIIDILTSSKYNTILTADAPIYIETLQKFWVNSSFLLRDKKAFTIISKIDGVDIEITPQMISTTFTLNDKSGMESYLKNDLHTEFIEIEYDAQLVGAIIFKLYFPPATKFLFHTLLICLSAKTTSFNEIPLKI